PGSKLGDLHAATRSDRRRLVVEGAGHVDDPDGSVGGHVPAAAAIVLVGMPCVVFGVAVLPGRHLVVEVVADSLGAHVLEIGVADATGEPELEPVAAGVGVLAHPSWPAAGSRTCRVVGGQAHPDALGHWFAGAGT